LPISTLDLLTHSISRTSPSSASGSADGSPRDAVSRRRACRIRPRKRRRHQGRAAATPANRRHIRAHGDELDQLAYSIRSSAPRRLKAMEEATAYSGRRKPATQSALRRSPPPLPPPSAPPSPPSPPPTPPPPPYMHDPKAQGAAARIRIPTRFPVGAERVLLGRLRARLLPAIPERGSSDREAGHYPLSAADELPRTIRLNRRKAR